MREKYLVLGAGISGLSFCNFITLKDYLILEQASEVGGYCRTIKNGEYVWDYAGHFFHYINPEMRTFFEPCFSGNHGVYVEKNTKIYIGGRLIDYPFQMNIHQLEKEDFIDCLYGIYFSETKEHYTSFKDMVRSKLGNGIAERFLIPYNEKLYACDLNKLDENAMGRFFPKVRFDDVMQNINKSKHIKGKSYNDTFYYSQKGAQVVVDYLKENLDSQRIRLNEKIERIDVENKIVYTDSDEYRYEKLINTIPLPSFLSLCGRNEYMQYFSWNKVLVFNIGFDLPSCNKKIHWIYFPDKKINFYRVGFYNNIANTEKMSIYVEIGFEKDAVIDIDFEYNRALDKLRECGIIKNHRVVAFNTLIMDPAYVHMSKQSIEILERLEQELNEKDIYVIGR